MGKFFNLDDPARTRIVFVILLAGLCVYSMFDPWLVTWAEENPWLSAPPIIGIMALAAWLFPGLADSIDEWDIFLDD